MSLQKDNWDKLFPHLSPSEAPLYLTQFEEALDLTTAANAICRISNEPIPTLSADQLSQRRTILNISLGLVLAQRDKALDSFCKAWLAYREANA